MFKDHPFLTIMHSIAPTSFMLSSYIKKIRKKEKFGGRLGTKRINKENKRTVVIPLTPALCF